MINYFLLSFNSVSPREQPHFSNSSINLIAVTSWPTWLKSIAPETLMVLLSPLMCEHNSLCLLAPHTLSLPGIHFSRSMWHHVESYKGRAL